MSAIYILIVVMAFSSSGPGTTVTAEFSSSVNCELALKQLLSNTFAVIRSQGCYKK